MNNRLQDDGIGFACWQSEECFSDIPLAWIQAKGLQKNVLALMALISHCQMRA